MKQKDIIVIIVIAFISAIASFLISGKVFVPSKNQQQVLKVSAISSGFETPSTKYFNNDAIDPTQSITIGSNDNQNPFNTPTGQ